MGEENKLMNNETDNNIETGVEEEYSRMLSDAVRDYVEAEGEWRFSVLLSVLLYGAATEQSVMIPLMQDEEGMFYPSVLFTPTGERFAALLTEESEKEPAAGEISLRLLFRELASGEDDLAGLIIDPHGAGIRIPAFFFSGAQLLFDAGYEEALQEEDKEEEPEDDDDSVKVGPDGEDEYTDHPFEYDEPENGENDEAEFILDVSCALPLTEKAAAHLEDVVHSLGTGEVKELYMDVAEGGEDHLIFIRVIRVSGEDGYHMELGMDMEEFDWEIPLTLCCGNMTEKQVLSVLRAVCVDLTSLDKIGLVWHHFRQKGEKGET